MLGRVGAGQPDIPDIPDNPVNPCKRVKPGKPTDRADAGTFILISFWLVAGIRTRLSPVACPCASGRDGARPCVGRFNRFAFQKLNGESDEAAG